MGEPLWKRHGDCFEFVDHTLWCTSSDDSAHRGYVCGQRYLWEAFRASGRCDEAGAAVRKRALKDDDVAGVVDRQGLV